MCFVKFIIGMMETNMKDDEKLLLEAIKNMLHDKVKLGLQIHNDDKRDEKLNPHDLQHAIEDEFRVRINIPEITMFDAVCAAFHHTHSYMNFGYEFIEAFRKQLQSLKVPQKEIEIILNHVETMVNDYKNKKYF